MLTDSNKKVGWVAGGAKVEELCGESFAFTQFVPNVGSSWFHLNWKVKVKLCPSVGLSWYSLELKSEKLSPTLDRVDIHQN